jgi:hypothetical protein
MLTPKQRAALALFEGRMLHDARNFGMKCFGGYFMHYVQECKIPPEQANELALRSTASILEQVFQEFEEKTNYTPDSKKGKT